ncbi:MAG: hypothetical protein QME96_07285, partial [Myxococcota bacterium]|nr:hypothetical protein [Myxococcota bacterium]
RRPGLPADTLDAALRAGKTLAAAGDVGSATKVIAAACRGVCPAEGAAEAFSALAAGIDVAGGFDEAFGVVRFLSSVPPDSAVYEPARRALGAARSALTARERVEAEDSLLAGRWSDGIVSFDRLRRELGDQREFNRHLLLKAKEFQGATATGPCVPIGLAGVRDPAAPSRNIGRPHVAWTGREYLVVWSDGRAAPETASTQQVHLQRLDAVGRRLEAADKTMSPPGVDARRPAVDFAGKHGGVVWHEVAGQGGRIVFVPIDFLGNAIGTPSVVAQAPTRSPFATVAVTRSGSGSAYAVAWQGRETLTARSADSNGYVWVRVGAPATEAGRRTIVRDVATIAFLDDSGAVVDGPRTLEGPAVQRPDGNRETRRGMPRPAWTRLPDVAGTPDGFVVTWEEDRSGDVAVIAAAFGPRGGEPLWTRTVTPEGVAPSSIEGRMPAVAVDGGRGRAAVIWVDRRPSPDVMFVSTLGPDGGILSTVPAARGTVRFLGGAVTGDRIVAAWWMRGRPSRLGLIPCDLAGSCPMTAGSGDTPGDFPLVGPDSRVGLAPGAAVGEIVAVWKETPGSSGAADDDETDEGPTAGDEVFFVRFRCS